MGLIAYIKLQITPTPMLRAGEEHLMIACSLGFGLGPWIGHWSGSLVWAIGLGH